MLKIAVVEDAQLYLKYGVMIILKKGNYNY